MEASGFERTACAGSSSAADRERRVHHLDRPRSGPTLGGGTEQQHLEPGAARSLGDGARPLVGAVRVDRDHGSRVVVCGVRTAARSPHARRTSRSWGIRGAGGAARGSAGNGGGAAASILCCERRLLVRECDCLCLGTAMRDGSLAVALGAVSARPGRLRTYLSVEPELAEGRPARVGLALVRVFRARPRSGSRRRPRRGRGSRREQTICVGRASARASRAHAPRRVRRPRRRASRAPPRRPGWSTSRASTATACSAAGRGSACTAPRGRPRSAAAASSRSWCGHVQGGVHAVAGTP